MNMSYASLTFLCDVLTAGTLSYVLYTWWRAPGFATWTRQAAEIDRLLKGSVREADAATKVMQERVVAERTAVERVLVEVADAKERLTKLLATAEAIERGQPLADASVKSQSSAPQVNFESAIERELERAEAPKSTGSRRVNIFGEEIGDEPAEATPAPAAYNRGGTMQKAARTKGLAAQVERIRYSTNDHELRARGFEENIADAEKLLAKGAPIKAVAREAKLAEADVKALAAAISGALKRDAEQEQPRSSSSSVNDANTKALSAMISQALKKDTASASFKDEQKDLDAVIESNKAAIEEVLTKPGVDPRLGVLSKGSGRVSATV